MKMHDIIDPIPGGPGPDDDREAHQVWREFELTVYALEMLSLSLAYRRAGLIWFPPLCHDGLEY